MHRFNLRRQSFVSIEVWWIVMHTYGNIAPQWGVLLSPFLIVKLHLMFLFMIIFLTYVRIRKYFFNTFLWCRVHKIETYCTIFRRLRLRTSHWRPLQFFFFTPSLFIINIHFIHISDLSHEYNQERLKYYSIMNTVNGQKSQQKSSNWVCSMF